MQKVKTSESPRVGFDPVISGLEIKRANHYRQWDLSYGKRKDNVHVRSSLRNCSENLPAGCLKVDKRPEFLLNKEKLEFY